MHLVEAMLFSLFRGDVIYSVFDGGEVILYVFSNSGALVASSYLSK